MTAMPASVASAGAPVAAAAPALNAGSMAQVILGLLLVVALLIAAAWLLRRFSSFGAGATGLVRVVGAAAVGQRERVVVVEIGGTWLLVGVAPGQVRALHTMPRHEAALASDATVLGPAPQDAGFAAWLRRMTEKRQDD